jgi:hypothetical protein
LFPAIDFEELVMATVSSELSADAGSLFLDYETDGFYDEMIDGHTGVRTRGQNSSRCG